MSIDLPPAVAAYFAADASGPAAVAACFTEDAVVTDERHTHEGRDAIRSWREKAAAAFDYTVTPRAVRDEGAAKVVTGDLVGNFPGSPVVLDYRFTLADGLISRLEIS
ncbi:DUF4440 domain-containing protein [Rhodobacterales bacterium HKCCE2091]|nr:DUF4440 domain-containing protein [Rhodobacterales bacterium HKCCE2091]